MEAICIANKHAEILFFSRFQPQIERNAFFNFLSRLSQSGNESPLMLCQGMEFVYIFQDDMYWCCCLNPRSFLTKIGPLFVVENLKDFHKICVTFLGTITQHSILSNVVLLQELIIETLGNGYMQTQSIDKLRSQILSRVNLPKETTVQNISNGLFGVEKWAPTSASQQPLRSSIENQKKEIYVDIVEKVCATVSKDGTLQRAEITGVIILHCFLLDNPMLFLRLNSDMSTAPTEGFNPNIHISEIEFGQDVDASKLASKKELQALARPGDSLLVRYSLPPSLPHALPFSLVSSLKQLPPSDVELKLKLTSATGMGTISPKVLTKIVVPSSTKTIMSQTSGPRDQTIVFDASQNKIVWKINDFPGGSYAESVIRLIDAGESTFIESAFLEFEVSKWVSSGLRIENVRLEPKTLKADKWVRYLTTSDNVIFKFTS